MPPQLRTFLTTPGAMGAARRSGQGHAWRSHQLLVCRGAEPITICDMRGERNDCTGKRKAAAGYTCHGTVQRAGASIVGRNHNENHALRDILPLTDIRPTVLPRLAPCLHLPFLCVPPSALLLSTLQSMLTLLSSRHSGTAVGGKKVKVGSHTTSEGAKELMAKLAPAWDAVLSQTGRSEEVPKDDNLSLLIVHFGRGDGLTAHGPREGRRRIV